MSESMSDGRYFAWVYHIQPWSPEKLTPQIIHDEGMYKYKANSPNHQDRFTVVAKVVLPESEYELSINELAQRYPAPPIPQTEDFI